MQSRDWLLRTSPRIGPVVSARWVASHAGLREYRRPLAGFGMSMLSTLPAMRPGDKQCADIYLRGQRCRECFRASLSWVSYLNLGPFLVRGGRNRDAAG